MSKHTPGPWKIGYKDGNEQLVIMNQHIEIATCWHHCVEAIEEEMQYNARLIAAAPELLKALKVVVEYIPEPDGACVCHLGHPPCSDCVENSSTREALEIARAAIAEATGGSND